MDFVRSFKREIDVQKDDKKTLATLHGQWNPEDKPCHLHSTERDQEQHKGLWPGTRNSYWRWDWNQSKTISLRKSSRTAEVKEAQVSHHKIYVLSFRITPADRVPLKVLNKDPYFIPQAPVSIYRYINTHTHTYGFMNKLCDYLENLTSQYWAFSSKCHHQQCIAST